MGSSSNKAYWRNYQILHNARNAPWLISNYEKATGVERGTITELTPPQILKVMGLPVPLLTFEFTNNTVLNLTSWHSDLIIDGVTYRSSADLIKGDRITNTTELHNDGSSFKLSAIRDEILQILESNSSKNAKIITQAAIINPSGDVEFALAIDVGIVTTSELTLDPRRGSMELSLKTDSIFKRLEGVPGTQLASSAQKAWFPNDTSFDQISSKLKSEALKTVNNSTAVGGGGRGSNTYYSQK
uniref:hypothetical protein n=1 Tax=Shewanella sp. TaxID=50422 RepID=UPI004048BB91